VAKCTFFRQTF